MMMRRGFAAMISSISGSDRCFAEIQRDGVDWPGDIRNRWITFLAQDFLERRD